MLATIATLNVTNYKGSSGRATRIAPAPIPATTPATTPTASAPLPASAPTPGLVNMGADATGFICLAGDAGKRVHRVCLHTTKKRR